jgi:crotonobetainyl-CoA:carnitine CoA-transferase CaiB-like acyl-CoA transferase
MLLEHLSAVEVDPTPTTAYAGHMLVELGAQVATIEPEDGSRLDAAPPFVQGRSATAAYLSAGKTAHTAGSSGALASLAGANIVLVAESGLPDAMRDVIDRGPMPAGGRVIALCTPYGVVGPKCSWIGTELTLFQAGGEGFLQPSGLALSEAPERSPLGVARYSASYSAGLTVAVAALAALRASRGTSTIEIVDVSIQDCQLSLNYLTISRYVEGFSEDRWNRSLRYGGVLRCRDGYVELIPIEEHQWSAVCAMLGHPEWTRDSRFATGMDRTQHGEEINAHLRSWAATRTVAEVTTVANEYNVPCSTYTSPRDLPASPQFQSREFFRPWDEEEALAPLLPGNAWIIDR